MPCPPETGRQSAMQVLYVTAGAIGDVFRDADEHPTPRSVDLSTRS